MAKGRPWVAPWFSDAFLQTLLQAARQRREVLFPRDGWRRPARLTKQAWMDLAEEVSSYSVTPRTWIQCWKRVNDLIQSAKKSLITTLVTRYSKTNVCSWGVNEASAKQREKMDPKITLAGEPSFGFLQKKQFTARQSLAVTRSKSYVHPKPEPDHYIWNRKPPDFSPQFYTSSAIFNEKMVQKRVNTSKDFKKVETSRKVMFPEVVLKKQTSNFVCRFKILDPFEAKIMFVKNGKYKTGAFKDLKPHDFRQSETNIPGFVTSFDRDPFNLKFKSKNLNTVHELLPDIKQLKGASSQSFDTCKPQELKWDSQLILRKEPWPKKSASYTRHRRSQGTYRAFMDRVEEKVTKLWQKEKELHRRQPMDTSDTAGKKAQ